MTFAPKRPCVVAFAYGAPETLLSNQTIACIAFEKARHLGGSVYAQSDIERPINYSDVPCYRIAGNSEKCPSSLRCAQTAICLAIEQNVAELWVAAAEPHIRRCARDLRRAAEDVKVAIAIHICQEIASLPDDTWYWRRSKHWQTRSRRVWRIREYILNSLPFSVYRRIAN